MGLLGFALGASLVGKGTEALADLCELVDEQRQIQETIRELEEDDGYDEEEDYDYDEEEDDGYEEDEEEFDDNSSKRGV